MAVPEVEEDEHTRHGGTAWRHQSADRFTVGTVKAARPLPDAASVVLTLRQGMETRCPAGAGRRQRSWLSAQHDSPGSRREVARGGKENEVDGQENYVDSNRVHRIPSFQKIQRGGT
ncbi:hypothetical protein [Mixta intestinalis]|nr:hypothetical protein [Mixta intestinalis]